MESESSFADEFGWPTDIKPEESSGEQQFKPTPDYLALEALREELCAEDLERTMETDWHSHTVFVGELDDDEDEDEFFSGEENDVIKDQFNRRDFLQAKAHDIEDKHKRELLKLLDKREKRVRLKEDEVAHEAHFRHDIVGKAFRKKEQVLKYRLKQKHAVVDVALSQLNDFDLKGVDEKHKPKTLYAGDSRVYTVEWLGRPQPLEVHIHVCNAVKDKLRTGTYAVRVSVRERIGGKELIYPKSMTQGFVQVTSPKPHSGNYSEKLLRFDESVLLLVPSKRERRPMMVFYFEVIAFMDDGSCGVVGTGIFPLLNNHFEQNIGKFKVPIMRGKIHTSVMKFTQIERLLEASIDEWLCNLYFEISEQNPLLVGEIEYKAHLVPEIEKVDMEESQGLFPQNYEEIVTSNQFKEFKHAVVKHSVFAQPVERMIYILNELVSELGFKPLRSFSFWNIWLYFIAFVWASRYTHYLGEWLFLKGQDVPVTRFEPRLLTMDLYYPEEVSLGVEVGCTILGTGFTLGLFVFFSIAAFIAFKLLGRFPSMIYRGISIFGVVVIFDFAITFFESIIKGSVEGDWTGDPFKLYFFFQRNEGSGMIGIMMTIFIYIGLVGLSSFFVYNYMLFVHMNGRLLDVYMRLSSEESYFFLPHDAEVSARYLEWVCYKARTYRSQTGLSRKVAVTNYLLSGLGGNSCTYIVIYTVTPEELRSVFRQFVILPSGAIVEMFSQTEEEVADMSKIVSFVV
mmetsp:Transcript_17229/g.30997  ORF Transcript_17229/g.30997 Transcript_17229/m.30997 type:complete len:738 (-) Transcript_17229:3038-5251(-)